MLLLNSRGVGGGKQLTFFLTSDLVACGASQGALRPLTQILLLSTPPPAQALLWEEEWQLALCV